SIIKIVMSFGFMLVCGVCINGNACMIKRKPVLFIIGDSTVKTGKGNGANNQWGWGSFLGENFDPDKLEVRNEALGGTSSRTFYNDPNLWPNILTQIQPGDFIMMQFGHNDSSPIVDSLRARGTMKGNGNEFVEVCNPLSQKKE